PAEYKGQGTNGTANAVIDPSDKKSALVTFGGEPGQNKPDELSHAVRPDQVNQITTGAILAPPVVCTVKDNAGRCNPEGSAPTQDVVFTAGRTSAPDLISVANFRPNFDSSETLVDFTFDQPAWYIGNDNFATNPPTHQANT